MKMDTKVGCCATSSCSDQGWHNENGIDETRVLSQVVAMGRQATKLGHHANAEVEWPMRGAEVLRWDPE
jgi:hypothetical protein